MTEIKKKKSSVISDVRYACAVGATNTVVAIKGAVPIANCSPGCQLKTTAMLTFENGFQGSVAAGGGNMQKQVQAMQAMQAKMEALQEEINEMETTASSGGGAVSVKVNGKKEVLEINLQPEVVDPDDIEMLQDLILTAVNEALRQMDEISNNEMNKLTGSLGLPAGIL